MLDELAKRDARIANLEDRISQSESPLKAKIGERMSIVIVSGLYVPTCDMCGSELKGEHDFYDAVDAKKAAGWKSMRYREDWTDICCDCQEETQ